MPYLKTHPIWMRFSEAADGQSEKRAIFHLFQKPEKIDFHKLHNLIDLSNTERSGALIETTDM